MTFEQALMVRNRIACPEVGYPISEAKYDSIKSWEMYNSDLWSRYLKVMQEDFCAGQDIW